MFCSHCGAEVKEGQKFCESCGAPIIPPEEREAANDVAAGGAWGAGEAEGAASGADDEAYAGFEISAMPTQVIDPGPVYRDDTCVDGSAYIPPASSDETIPMPTVDYGVGAYQPMYVDDQAYCQADASSAVRPIETESQKKEKEGGISTGATVAIVILLLIALGILVGLLVSLVSGSLTAEDIDSAVTEFVQGDLNDVAASEEDVEAVEDEEESEESEESADEEAADEEAALEEAEEEAAEEEREEEEETVEEETETVTLSDAEIYSVLDSSYDGLSSLDSQISDIASTFNSYYMDSSYSTREAYAAEAEALQQEIAEAAAVVDALEVPSTSDYYSTWQNISTLYYCLQQRIDVICEAWDVSLSYEDPSGHDEEILAPIVAARNESGVNQYLAQYDELYPSSEPVAPSE